MNRLNSVLSLLLVFCLVFGSVPAFAHSAVLPNAEVMSDEELEAVEGEGPAAAALIGTAGFMVGGVVGGLSYVVDYAWDKYIAKSEPTFDSDEFSKKIWTGAATGGAGAYIGALLMPTP